MAGEQFERYVTEEGDMVDLVAFRRFGLSTAQTEAIYAANPNLAALGPRLPAGIEIKIPLPIITDRRQSTRLWE